MLRALLARQPPRRLLCDAAAGADGRGRQPAEADNFDPGNVALGDPRLYAGHHPTDSLQRLLLAAGSGVACLLAPWRDDMISIFGETTGACALAKMRQRMLADPTGRRVLLDRPRIRESTVDLAGLRRLPRGSLGRAYTEFLDRYGYSPDARRTVGFVDDAELAYVMQRYRELHDLNHVLLGQGTDFLGEVTVKWFEAFQTGLPLCVTGAYFGAVRLRPKQRRRYLETHLPFALRCGSRASPTLNFYFEENWHMPLAEARRLLNIETPPGALAA